MRSTESREAKRRRIEEIVANIEMSLRDRYDVEEEEEYGHMIFDNSNLMGLDAADLKHMTYARQLPVSGTKKKLSERIEKLSEEVAARRQQRTSNKGKLLHFFVTLLRHKAYTIISMPTELTMDEFMDGLLSSFKFEKDHLYAIGIHNYRGISIKPTTKLEDLPLVVGDVLNITFDFGDNWNFFAMVKDIKDNNEKETDIKVIKKHGSSPKQYYTDSVSDDSEYTNDE